MASTLEQFEEEDVRLVDIADSFGAYLKYLLKKFYIVLIGVGGIAYGLYYYAKKAPPEYVAFTSFNTTDPRGIATSGLISLASSFGFGASGTTVDLLAGLYKSRLVFYTSMLDEVMVDGKPEKLGTHMMRVYGLDYEFKNTKGKENFAFTANRMEDFSKDEQRIANILYGMFSESLLEAEYEITSGLIFAEITTPDYELSKNLATCIIANVSKYYQNEQITGASISYRTVSKKADSLKREIDWREQELARSTDRSLYNVKREGTFDQDFLRQEVATLRMMYTEATSTMASAKAAMNPQAAPVRVVDHPKFSTYPKYKSTLFYSLIGIAVGIVVVIIPMLIRKAILIGREEDELRAKLKAQAAGETI
jgi:hypothetical protein